MLITYSLSIWLKGESEHLPSCSHYAELTDIYHDITGLDYETIRARYGSYTYKEWKALLGKHIKGQQYFITI